MEQAVKRTKEGNAANTQTLVMGAFFLALGMVMPFLTGQIPEIGNKLLPMHLPVLLCGFVCGWKYGLLVGFITPLLRSMVFGMPVMMPMAAGMAFELAAYGSVSGLLYEKLPKTAASVYASLAGAMLAGRLVWGIVSIPLYGIAGKGFSWQMFVAGGFLNAIPGIILQLVLIPVIVLTLRKARLMD
ncbi:MAG: ECF transporter S component [Lachnospiraceae bacterium]|nr:ECF transporter S component [Lachnospiraceae bacterium]